MAWGVIADKIDVVVFALQDINNLKILSKIKFTIIIFYKCKLFKIDV